MPKNIIDLNLRRKVRQIKKLYPEFRILNIDFEKVLSDISFFKEHSNLVRKSDILFNRLFKNNKNYSKSVLIQQEFVEELTKMG